MPTILNSSPRTDNLSLLTEPLELTRLPMLKYASFCLFLISASFARTCSFLTDDGCDITAIQSSPCINNSIYSQYAAWQIAVDECDCAAYDSNLVFLNEQYRCVNNDCLPSDADCAIGCAMKYNAGRTIVTKAKCACYADANAKCLVPTPPATPNPVPSPVNSPGNNGTTEPDIADPVPIPTTPSPPPVRQCAYSYTPGSAPVDTSRPCLNGGKKLEQSTLLPGISNGCGAEGAACSCVDCDDTPMLVNRIVKSQPPPVDSNRSACATASGLTGN